MNKYINNTDNLPGDLILKINKQKNKKTNKQKNKKTPDACLRNPTVGRRRERGTVTRHGGGSVPRSRRGGVPGARAPLDGQSGGGDRGDGDRRGRRPGAWDAEKTQVSSDVDTLFLRFRGFRERRANSGGGRRDVSCSSANLAKGPEKTSSRRETCRV